MLIEFNQYLSIDYFAVSEEGRTCPREIGLLPRLRWVALFRRWHVQFRWFIEEELSVNGWVPRTSHPSQCLTFGDDSRSV